MTSEAVLVNELVASHPDLQPLLEEHLQDNFGELLPYPFIADVMRSLIARVDRDRAFCASVLNWLEDRCMHGSDEERGLIAVSGTEMLPDPGEPGAELRELLGPCLGGLDAWATKD